MQIQYLIIPLSCLIILGCGGGGNGGGNQSNNGDNTNATMDPAQQGRFLDSAVQGLRYQTNTLSGETNANGEFEYQEDETVAFFLEDLEIGQAPGYNIVTPLDLSTNNAHDDYGINLLRLLQTLDTDGDPSNGITLPDLDSAANIDLNQSLTDFASDTDTIDFISAHANTPLIDASVASNHFSGTLNSASNNYTLELAGSSWSSVITLSYCDSSVTGGFDYVFSDDSYIFTGTDEFNSVNFTNCSVGASSAETANYNDFSDFPLSCGPSCTYNEVNQIISGTDTDNREFITIVWHTPNSDTVTFTKRILSDPSGPGSPYTFKEVITRQ